MSELSIFSFGTFCDTRLVAGASDGATGSTGLYWSAEVQLALQNCLSESEHHVLTQEEAEEEAVLWANLNKNGN